MARQATDQYKQTATHDEQAAHLHRQTRRAMSKRPKTGRILRPVLTNQSHTVFHLNSSTPINIDQPARGRDWHTFNLS
jgi:hypothetical protein